MKEISVVDLPNEAFIIWRGEQAITMHERVLALVQEGGFPLRVAQSAPSLYNDDRAGSRRSGHRLCAGITRKHECSLGLQAFGRSGTGL